MDVVHDVVRVCMGGMAKVSFTMVTMYAFVLLMTLITVVQGLYMERTAAVTFSSPPNSSLDDPRFHPSADRYTPSLLDGATRPKIDFEAPSDFGETNTDPPEELKRSTKEVVYSIQSRMSRKTRKFDASKTRAKVYYEYRSPEPSPSPSPSPTPTNSYHPRFPYRPLHHPHVRPNTPPRYSKHTFRLDHPAVKRLAGGSREPTEIRVWLQFDKKVWKAAVYRTVRDILNRRGLGHKFGTSRKFIYKRQGGRAYLVYILFQHDYRATLVF